MIAAVLVFPASGVASFTIVLAANRYFYLPIIGFILVVTWWLARLADGSNGPALRRRCLAVAAIVLLVAGAEANATRGYVRHWRTTVELCEYMLSLFPDSYRVHDDLGIALRREGRLEEAADHLRSAIRDKPTSYQTHYNLALVLEELGGQSEQVIRHYRRAVQIKPTFLKGHLSLGWALFRAGDERGGLAGLTKAVELAPGASWVQYNYGRMLVMAGRPEDGLGYLRKAIETPPRPLQAIRDLAWFLATHPDAEARRPKEAVRLAEQAESLTRGQDTAVMDTLAAAYASNGQYAKAADTAGKALVLARQTKSHELADQIEKRVRLYQSGCPYHEAPKQQLERPEARREAGDHRPEAAY